MITSGPWSRLCRDCRRIRAPAPPRADQRRRAGRWVSAIRVPARLGSRPARLGHQRLLWCRRRGRRRRRRARAVPAARRPRKSTACDRPGARVNVSRPGRFRRLRDSRKRRRRQDDAGPARHRHLSGVPGRDHRSSQPTPSLSLHQLHELRASVQDHRVAAVRPAELDDGGVRAVRGVPARIRGPARPPVPRAAQCLPGLRPAPRALGRGRAAAGRSRRGTTGGRGPHRGGRDRRREGPRRVPSRGRRAQRWRGAPVARDEGPRGEAVRADVSDAGRRGRRLRYR